MKTDIDTETEKTADRPFSLSEILRRQADLIQAAEEISGRAERLADRVFGTAEQAYGEQEVVSNGMPEGDIPAAMHQLSILQDRFLEISTTLGRLEDL